MKYRTLGDTSLQFSEIGFGCGPTAGLIVSGSRNERREAVARALDLGITYFDTASVYADGVSEDHLGETLSDLGARPVVGTKVVIREDELDDVSGAVMRCFEGSLKRLRIDSVDVLHLHNRLAMQRVEGSNVGIGPLLSVDDLLGPGGVLEAFEKLRDQGKTRSLGICSFGGEVPAINQAIDTDHFQSLLAYYNILNPTAARKPPAGFEDYDYGQVMERGAAHNMGSNVLRILAGGGLSGVAERHAASGGRQNQQYEDDVKRAQALRFLTRDGRYTLAQVAIRFGLDSSEAFTVLVGFSSIQQIEEAAECSGTDAFTNQELEAIEALYQTDFGFRNSGA